MTSLIELIGMEFHAFHGCLSEERLKGARYLVDFSCEYDTRRATKSDNLKDTLDYSEIYNIVKKEMDIPSNLLEHVAGRIAAAIRKAHPEIPTFVIKISKENPPVGGKTAWASVSIEG